MQILIAIFRCINQIVISPLKGFISFILTSSIISFVPNKNIILVRAASVVISAPLSTPISDNFWLVIYLPWITPPPLHWETFKIIIPFWIAYASFEINQSVCIVLPDPNDSKTIPFMFFVPIIASTNSIVMPGKIFNTAIFGSKVVLQ